MQKPRYVLYDILLIWFFLKWRLLVL